MLEKPAWPTRCCGTTATPVLHGAATQDGTPPYGPLVAVLRAYRRLAPAALAPPDDPLLGYLGVLLPELGPPPGPCDHATLWAALRAALESIATTQAGAAIFLDDLHWADSATLDLLATLAGSLEETPMLVLGAYRTDEIPRAHPLPRMRTDLRRGARLREIVIEPLDRTETAALAAGLLAGTPGAALLHALYDRTLGVPFFVEELAGALLLAGRLRPDRGGDLELAGDGWEAPIPASVRDAVLLRAESLTDMAPLALEIAAVAGVIFDLDLVGQLAPGGDSTLHEPLERGLLVELPNQPGRAAFRHALVREAIYGDIIWTRRRALHHQVAEQLELRGESAVLVAEHWQLAGETDQARAALLAAADAACTVHAYRDAAQATRARSGPVAGSRRRADAAGSARPLRSVCRTIGRSGRGGARLA